MNSIQWLLNTMLKALVIAGFLIVAPILYVTVPFIAIANVRGDYDTMMMFTGFYMCLGPCVAAFWTMFILNWMNIHEKKEHFGFGKNIGIMFLAGVTSAAAELALVLFQCFTQAFGTRMYASEMFNHFYVIAPFAVFAPVLLFILVRILRRIGQDQQDDQIENHNEALRFARQYAIDKRHAEAKQQLIANDEKLLRAFGVRNY